MSLRLRLLLGPLLCFSVTLASAIVSWLTIELSSLYLEVTKAEISAFTVTTISERDLDEVVSSNLFVVGAMLVVVLLSIKSALSAKLVHRPPGYRLRSFTKLYSRKTREKILEPILRDMQDEYLEALASDDIWLARFVQLRGYYGFWEAICLLWVGSLARKLWDAARGSTSG